MSPDETFRTPPIAARATSSPDPDVLRALVEESEEAMAVVDGEGAITWANRAFGAALGYEAHELDGARLTDLSPAGGERALEAFLADARRAGMASGAWSYQRSDGSSAVVRQRVSRVGERDGVLAIAFRGSGVPPYFSPHAARGESRPLAGANGDEDVADAVARHAARHAAHLAALAGALAVATTAADVVDAAIAIGSEAMGASGGALALLDERAEWFTLVAGPGISPDVEQSWQRYPNEGSLPAVCATRSHRPCYSRTRAEYVAHSALLAETAERLGIHADATLPLIGTGERVLGVVSFIFDAPQPFTPEDDAFLRELAALCAQALDRARLLERERGARLTAEQEREQLSRLIDALPVMVTVYDPSLTRTPSGAIRFNRAFIETLGWTTEDARHGDLMELCYPDPEIRAMAALHMERAGSEWLEIPTRAKDGRIVPVRWGNVQLAGDRTVGVGVDLTAEQARAADRERLLRALAYERERLANVFEQAPLFMAMMRGPQHVLERVNAAYLRFYGDRPRLGVPIAVALPELVAHGRTALMDRVLATGEPYVGTGLPLTLHRTESGVEEERFVDLIYVPLTEGDGTRSGVVAIGSDATARVHAERGLHAALDAADLERRRLEAVLAAIPVGVAVVEAPNGNGLYVNTALRQLHGGDAGMRSIDSYDDQWACFHTTANGEVGPRFRAEELPVSRALYGGETVVDEAMILRRTDGELRMTSVSAAPIRDGDGEIVGAVAIARDTEDEHRARMALDEARRAAEEANRAKTQFLANMSHELRTPLNAIAGHTQLLEMELHGPVTRAQSEALARIQRAQRHLLGLINDVLNFAKLQSGSVEYDVRALDVREVLADVTAMVEPLLISKELRLTVDIPADAPLVWGDREKLMQVLLNLLSNAVKFTPAAEGTGRRPAITVSLFTRAEHPDEVYLRVKDPGVGIARERHEAIFDPFVQVRADLTRAHEGTGLGLAISRNLARGMGGRLRVRSELGAGASFTIVLRRVVAADGAPTDRRLDDERRSGRERRRAVDRRG